MIEFCVILSVIVGVVLLLKYRTLLEILRQLRLFRRSMRSEFRRLEAEQTPVLAEQHARKVSIEG